MPRKLDTSTPSVVRQAPLVQLQHMIRSIAVLGAGHGGFAAAADLTRQGFEVRLQSRNQAKLDQIRERGGIEMLAEFDERSQAADIPLVIPQALIPIGLALNAILVGARMIAGFRTNPQDAAKAL